MREKKKSEVILKLSNIIRDCQITCPICGETLKDIDNQWVKKKLDYPKNIQFCSKCKINVHYWQSISGNYGIVVSKNFNKFASLSGEVGRNCVERYMEPSNKYVGEINIFNKNIEEFKEKYKKEEVENNNSNDVAFKDRSNFTIFGGRKR